jgi:hypothetical protein
MVRNHCIGLPSFRNGLLACCAVTHPALRAQQPQGIGYASIYGWLHTCFGSTCVCVWAAASAWCVQPLISVCVGCVPSLGAACWQEGHRQGCTHPRHVGPSLLEVSRGIPPHMPGYTAAHRGLLAWRHMQAAGCSCLHPLWQLLAFADAAVFSTCPCGIFWKTLLSTEALVERVLLSETGSCCCCIAMLR